MTNQLADRATSDLLIGPDWAMNLEICDILNHDPGQARDFVKDLKKRIRSKNPKVQLLALTLLETVVKNCGDMVLMHIADKDIPHEMVKIAKKKLDIHVKEKILVLIEVWQEVFGGPHGRYPQFFIAYHDLLRAGVVFPKRAVKPTPIFSSIQSRTSSSFPYLMRKNDKKIEKLSPSGDSKVHVLSLADIQNGRAIMDILVEMLNALKPENKEGVKQEVIVELAEQCRQYRQKVVHLVNSTSDEELLCQGLALNDDLQNALSKYNVLANGFSKKPKKLKSLQDLVDIDEENLGEANDLHRRTSSATFFQQLMLPAPPGENLPISSPISGRHQVDLLSGEDYNATSIENSLALAPINETSIISPRNSLVDEQNIISPRNSNNTCSGILAFPAEQVCAVESQFQQQQLSLQYLNERTPNNGQSLCEQASTGDVDQGGAFPPPPWEIELPENGQPLALQQTHLLSEQTGEISYLSPRMMGNQSIQHNLVQGSQPMGMYPPYVQDFHLSNAYSQSVQDGQMSGYNNGQPSDSQLNGDNSSYYYSLPNEVSERLHGISIQDRYMSTGHYYQSPTSSSTCLQQPMKQLKADDNLFGDLVSMTKSKANKPAN